MTFLRQLVHALMEMTTVKKHMEMVYVSQGLNQLPVSIGY